ncbi:hypothetical protein Tco_1377384 [Tanacetum coccineum]
MANFIPGQAVIDAAQRKGNHGKYMDECAAIGYGFLIFSFSSLGELEACAVTLLKRSQREDRTSDWLRAFPISGLGKTMNAYSRVFNRDIYRDHVVSCAGIVGIKHSHNVERYSLVDISYCSEISAGLDVCVDLTGSSPLTQTGMADFVPGQAMIDVAERKRGKYMAKCAAIGYGFLPFSFSSLEELEADAVTLLKRIQKLSMSQDIGARAAFHIFNRISFAIPKGVRTQIVSRIWLCGVCFKTHTLRIKCRHGPDSVPPPDIGDGRFVLYDLTRPLVPSCSQLVHGEGLVPDQHNVFTLSLLDSLFSKGLHTIKSIPPKCRLGFSRVLKGALDKVICKPDDIACWVSLLVLPLCLLKTFSPRSNLEYRYANKRQRQEECITNAIRSWGVPGGSVQLMRETLAESVSPMLDLDEEDLDLTEQNLKLKSFPRGTSCGRDGLRAQYLMDCLSGATIAISDELVSSITQVVNLFLEGKCPTMLGEYIASAPLTPLVKSGGGIRPIAVGGGEAILHAVNRLVEDRGDDVGVSMPLVDFQNAFNLSSATLALPDCTTENTPCGRAKGCSRAWYLDDGTIVGDNLVVGKVLELITEDGPRCGLHLNVDKTELFWPKENPRSRLEGVFPPNISRPLHVVKLLGGPVSVDPDFSNALVTKRVSKTIGLLDAVAKINDPQCELLLIRACAGISKLYFAMRTCPPRVFESAQLAFDMALRSALERIVTASGPGFGDWQWRLATLPFAFGGLGVYSAGDVLNYAFVSSRLQSAALQTRLLRHVGLAAYGSTFDDAMCGKKHTSDWPACWFGYSGLGQPMTVKDLLCVLCYPRLGVPLFAISKPCSACSKVFTGDVYGDHVVLYMQLAGLDVCVDLTGSSPLTQTGMADFVPGRAVIDGDKRKRCKYLDKCRDIGYGFLPFSFSSFGELEKGAVTLLKRVRKFSMAQDIRARAAVYIFNRISFSIAKEVGAQIVSRLSSNFCNLYYSNEVMFN